MKHRDPNKGSIKSCNRTWSRNRTRIADYKISLGNGCETCYQEGECNRKDAIQELYKKLLVANRITLGSPV